MRKSTQFRMLLTTVLVLSGMWEAVAVGPYEPIHPDPVLEPWRWQTYAELSGRGLLCVAEGKDGKMWFGTEEGVSCYDGLKWTHDGQIATPVNCIFSSSDGSVYAGTNTGINQYSSDHWRQIFPEGGNLPWNVHDLEEDSNGGLWAATAWGALLLEKQSTRLYTTQQMSEALKVSAPDLEVVVIPPNAHAYRPWPEGPGFRAVDGIDPAPGVIWAIAPEGPAATAGLQIGDRLVVVDDHPRTLQHRLDGMAGTPLSLTVSRSDSLFDVTIVRAAVPGNYADLHVYDLHSDPEGDIWFGVSGRTHGGEILHWKRPSESPEDGGQWRLYTADDGLEIGWRPRSLRTRDGTLWVGTFDGRVGLSRYQDGVWRNDRLSETKVRFPGDSELLTRGMDSNTSLLQTRDGTLWIGMNNGLAAYRQRPWERRPRSKPEGGVSVLVQMPGWKLVLDQALHALGDGVWTVYRQHHAPVPATRIFGLVEAADGALWMIGRGQEVVRLEYGSDKWQTYRGLSFWAEGPDGALWFLSQDGGVVRQQNGEWVRYGTDDGVMDSPTGLLITRAGAVWATGSHNGCAATAEYREPRWSLHTHPRLAPAVSPRAIYESDDGSLWFGTDTNLRGDLDRGALRYDGHTWHHFRPLLETPENIYGISQSADGTIWFGGSSLRSYDGTSWTSVLEPRELLRESWTEVVYSDHRGNLWIGTRNYGVIHFDGKGWTRYNVQNGLAGNRVKSILRSEDSSLWVATDKGISRFDGRTWTTHALPKELLHVTWNGLRESSDGSLWINRDGETIRYRSDANPPDTRISVSPGEVSRRGTTTIAWEGVDRWDQTLNTELQYAWRLDGGPWSPFTPKRTHTLPALISGQHTFEVVARDKDFNTDPSPAAINFSVTPSVWRQPWFLALMAAVLAVIGLQTSRVVVRGKKLREMVVELSTTNRKLKEMDAAKTDFFSNVSHELRTPLTAIKGYIDNIIDGIAGDTTQQQQRYLSRVKSNADRLTWHINELLDLARFESGRSQLVDLTVSEISMSDVVSETVDNLKPTAETSGIRLEHHCEPANVLADRNRAVQIVMNLVMNGIKFTGRGGEVHVHVARQEDGFVRTSVRDTGKGIGASDLERIFDRFYRAGEDRKVQPGAGLGLPISKELVELQGGSIWVESEPGVGSTFSFTLPESKST